MGSRWPRIVRAGHESRKNIYGDSSSSLTRPGRRIPQAVTQIDLSLMAQVKREGGEGNEERGGGRRSLGWR